MFIRKYESADEEALADVCYATGYMGETLLERGVFDDRLLFTKLFCRYYPRYEPHNCFVLVDSSSGKIAGYVIGSLDTRRQARRFALKMGYLIAIRAVFLTSWRYPESWRSILAMLRYAVSEKKVRYLLRDYPAHLHINILPEYQSLGMGSQLLQAFENWAVLRGAVGIHLKTTSRNVKALAFYERKGYSVISENDVPMWPGEDSKGLLLGKRLTAKQ